MDGSSGSDVRRCPPAPSPRPALPGVSITLGVEEPLAFPDPFQRIPERLCKGMTSTYDRLISGVLTLPTEGHHCSQGWNSVRRPVKQDTEHYVWDSRHPVVNHHTPEVLWPGIFQLVILWPWKNCATLPWHLRPRKRLFSPSWTPVEMLPNQPACREDACKPSTCR